MTEKKLPSEIYSEIKHEIKNKKEKLAEGAEKLGYAYQQLEDGETAYKALDSVFISGKSDPVVTSSMQILCDFQNQVRALKPRVDEVAMQIDNISGNAIFISATSTSNASFVNWPKNLTAPNMNDVRNKRQIFERYEHYASILEHIDSSLAETFKSIKSTYFGSRHDSFRIAIEQARQAWDHLIRKLVCDEEVKNQLWWPSWHPNLDEPETVTRQQRMRLAAEKYVQDHNQRSLLISEGTHTNEIYNRLQKFHTPGPLKENEAKDALFEMVRIIEIWIDSINWGLISQE